MKKTILRISLVVALICSAIITNAQDGRFSLGAELAFPMGDFGDQSSIGFGGSVRYEHPAGDNLGLTLTAGYITFGGKSISDGFGGEIEYTNSMIPVQLGAKYYFTDQQDGFYGMVELGIHNFKSEYSQPGYTILGITFPGVDVSASSTEISYAPAIGYHLANIDLGLRYQMIATEGSSTSYLGLRIAYVFGEQ